MRKVFRPKKLHLPASITKDRRWKCYRGDIIGAWDIALHHSRLACKTVFFKTRKAMHAFHDDLAERGIINHGKIPKSAFAFVADLSDHLVKFDKGGGEKHRLEVDPSYFAICCFVEGYCNADSIPHEAVHVANCYDRRMKPNRYLEAGDHEEEAICYPTGIYARIVTRLISREGIRAIGGDGKEWRKAWDRDAHRGYLNAFLQWPHDCPESQAWLEGYRRSLTKVPEPT